MKRRNRTVGISPAPQARLLTAEKELTIKPGDAQTTTKASDDQLPRYKRLVADLARSLQQDTPRARTALRELFGEIRLVAQGAEVWLNIMPDRSE